MAAIGRFQKGDDIFYAKVVDGEVFRLRGDVFGSPSFDKKATPLKGVRILTPVNPSKLIAIGRISKPNWLLSLAVACATSRPLQQHATYLAIPRPRMLPIARSRIVRASGPAPSRLILSLRLGRAWKPKLIPTISRFSYSRTASC